VIYLLDTDTFNHFHRGRAQVLDRTRSVGQQNLAITIITRVEVLQGRFEFLRKAANASELKTAQQRLDESDRALMQWRVIRLDSAACSEFERLRAQKALRKIGRADLLIASIVRANGATLVTRNVRDFQQIQGLRLENWAD